MGFRAVLVFVAALGAIPGAALADTLKAPSGGYPTIQSAIDAAGPYDTIQILAGDHDESPVVSGKSYLRIKAKKSTILNGFTVQNCDYVLVSGFTVSGGSTGVTVVDSQDVKVSKVRITGTTSDGVYLEDCARVEISKVVVSFAGGHGIHDDAGEDIVVSKCTVTDCGGDGIHMSTENAPANGSDRAVVSKNRIAGCVNGVTAGGDELVIEKNRVDDPATTGILIQSVSGSADGIIQKNRITSEGPIITAIDFDGTDISLFKNTVVRGRITEAGSDNAVLVNKVSGVDTGITLQGLASGAGWNTVRECDTGIATNGVSEVLLANRVFDCGTGIRVQGDGLASQSNRVVRAEGIGFLVSSTGNGFFYETCFGSGHWDLADTHAVDVSIYVDCRFGLTQFNYNP